MRSNKIKILVTVLLTVFYQPISEAQSSFNIKRSDCFLADCSGFETMDNVEFGYLTVPEDYSKPDGRQIDIAFAVIKSKVENPETDAVMYFQGGWGAPILNQSLLPYARGYPVKNRDVIMLDFRGSGLSQPQLCDWLGLKAWEDLNDDLSIKNFNKNQTARFNQCLDSLELKNIDFNQYGSNTKSKDAVMLAKALGYTSYNLHGISYGTRAILNFIRNAEHSDVKIRSVFMDSNTPIGLLTNGTMSKKYEDVLSKILNDCEQNPGCKQKFPDLKSRFEQFLQSLDSEPWTVPLNGNSTFTANKEELNALMHNILYNQRTYKNLPILLEHLIARDNNILSLVLASRVAQFNNNYNAPGAISYVYDHKYFRDSTKVRYAAYLATNSPYRVMNAYLDFYLTDQRIITDSLAHIPIESDIPALILSGSYDPMTPPSYNKFMAASFSNHFYIEVPRVGHAVGPSISRCGSPLLKQFIDNPNQRPDNSCFESLGENLIPFRTSYYKNSNIGILLNKLRAIDLLLVIPLLFIVLVSLINTVKFFANIIKHKEKGKLGLYITSLLILVFLIGFYALIQKTTSADSFLLLFGLVKSANFIFYLSALVLAMGLVNIISWIRSTERSKWDIITVVSFVLFAIITIEYSLFPNF